MSENMNAFIENGAASGARYGSYVGVVAPFAIAAFLACTNFAALVAIVTNPVFLLLSFVSGVEGLLGCAVGAADEDKSAVMITLQGIKGIAVGALGWPVIVSVLVGRFAGWVIGGVGAYGVGLFTPES